MSAGDVALTVAASETICFLDGPADGAANMAADAAWLDRVQASQTPLTVLRLYGWEPATVSVGRHQVPETAFQWDYCRAHGIPWVRRPSGGRAVFHAAELTYAVISNDLRRFPGGVTATYTRIGTWLAEGLQACGVTAIAAGRHSPLAPAPRSAPLVPCFLTPTRGALLCDGRKLVGSAQHRRAGSFLQHGSIPLQVDFDVMGAVLGVAAHRLSQSLISLEEACGRPLDRQQVATALKTAFTSQFN